MGSLDKNVLKHKLNLQPKMKLKIAQMYIQKMSQNVWNSEMDKSAIKLNLDSLKMKNFRLIILLDIFLRILNRLWTISFYWLEAINKILFSTWILIAFILIRFNLINFLILRMNLAGVKMTTAKLRWLSRLTI